MTAPEIAALLNAQLKIDAFRDVSHNGLQIENRGEVTRVATAVDGSLETLEAAVAMGAQMVLVHHGISWGESLAQISGANYRVVSYALAHNLALYAAHLPLDAHPTLGNNAQLAQAFKLQATRPFLTYHGQTIGVAGALPEPLSHDAFAQLAQALIQPRRMEFFDCGVAEIRTVGICSGGAPEGIVQAAQAGLDLYLCGEATLQAYNLAHDWGINALFAGHYATERFGIRALGDWLAAQTALPCDFIDFDLPY